VSAARSALIVFLLAACVARPAAGVTVRPGFTATPVVEGLDQPTAAGFAPDGRLLVVEKTGAVRLWTAAGGLRATPLLTLPVCTDSEMGLLGLAFHPNFLANGFVYLYQTQPPGGDPARCAEGVNAGRRNRVVRVTLGPETIDPESLVVIVDGLRTDGGNHDGGVLRFGPDGMLYVGVGDTGIGDGGAPGASTNPYADDLMHREGKILRVRPNGDAPDDNPFVGMGGDAAFVYAYGLRNPFRFAFDPIVPGPQLLWAGDVGQVTWEESASSAPATSWMAGVRGFAPAAQCRDERPPIRLSASRAERACRSWRRPLRRHAVRRDVPQRLLLRRFRLNQVYRADVNGRAAASGRSGHADPPRPGPSNAVGPDGALCWVAIGNAVIRVTQDDARAPRSAAASGHSRAAGLDHPTRATRRVARCLSAARRRPARAAPAGAAKGEAAHREDVRRRRPCPRLRAARLRAVHRDAGARGVRRRGGRDHGGRARVAAGRRRARPLSHRRRARLGHGGQRPPPGDRRLRRQRRDGVRAAAVRPAPPAGQLARRRGQPPADVCSALACAACRRTSSAPASRRPRLRPPTTSRAPSSGSCVSPGTYYLLFRTDAFTNLFEDGNDGSNDATPVQITVN
jgi:hypothetical protein